MRGFRPGGITEQNSAEKEGQNRVSVFRANHGFVPLCRNPWFMSELG